MSSGFVFNEAKVKFDVYKPFFGLAMTTTKRDCHAYCRKLAMTIRSVTRNGLDTSSKLSLQADFSILPKISI